MLRPVTARLAVLGITANVVTILAAIGSIAVGAIVTWRSDVRSIFFLIPIWFFVRMALNAIDGMLAREFHQKSVLGGYLNELGDVISDAALYAPFAFISPFGSTNVALIVVLSIVAEFAGVLGLQAGASRRYDGPMGKSDRALVFGALGFWAGTSMPPASWMPWVMPLVAALLVFTIVNRVRSGIREAAGTVSPIR